MGNGQKYDPNSPINGVMLDNVIKQRMENPLNEADVRPIASIIKLHFFKLFSIYDFVI